MIVKKMYGYVVSTDMFHILTKGRLDSYSPPTQESRNYKKMTIIYRKFRDESGMKRISIITAGDETATACYGQMTDCCLSPTTIMKHFWK